MQGHKVQLYAILLDGALHRYPKVEVLFESEMPSGGDLSNPNDEALVTSLEDKMIEAYGTALVEVKCKAAGGEAVDLNMKMLRPMHVGSLFAAVERYQVAELNLEYNQLGAAGGALNGPQRATLAALALFTFLCHVCAASSVTTSAPRLAWRSPRPSRATRPSRRSSLLPCHLEPTRPRVAALQPATLAALALFTFLCRVRSLFDNKLGPEAGMAFAEALKGNTTLTFLESAALPSRTQLAHASRALDMHPSFRALHPTPHPSSDASQPRPARALNATSHSLRVPRTSHARAQPTHGLRTHRAYGRPRANTLAAATGARTPRGPRPRPPLPTGEWRVRVHPPTCTCPSQPARQRPRQKGQEGPQSGRRQRPRAAVPLEQLGSLRVARQTLGGVA
eukprot:scaffold26560_cov53-Phaeocystis_antarctica.AAC.2